MREQLAEAESLAASYAQQAQEAEEKAVYWESKAIERNESLEQKLRIALDVGQKMETGWERARQRLTESEEDKKRLQFENECLLADQTRADAATRELQDQLNSTRDLLEDQADKAGEWYGKAKEAENLAEQRWLLIERLQQRQLLLSSPSVSEGKLSDTTPDSQADPSKPLVADSEPLENMALAVNPLEDIPAPAAASSEPVGESQQLTRKQLGELFGGISHETIRQWDKAGKLASLGWSRVPGTGSSPKNPRLYRTSSPSATK